MTWKLRVLTTDAELWGTSPEATIKASQVWLLRTGCDGPLVVCGKRVASTMVHFTWKADLHESGDHGHGI